MVIPAKIPETGPLKKYWRILNDWRTYIISLTPRKGIGIRHKHTSNGVTSTVVLPEVEEAAASSSIKQFKITAVAVSGNYFSAAEWDGTSLGEVKQIARPYKLRRAPFHGQTITHNLEDPISGNQALTITYNYLSDTFRTATIGGVFGFVERQVIIPNYQVGDLIYATEPEGGTGVTGITWQDLNVDGRAWARKS